MKLIEIEKIDQIGEVITDIIYDYKQTKIAVSIAFSDINPKYKLKEAIITSIKNSEMDFSYDTFNLVNETSEFDELKQYFGEIGDVRRSDIAIAMINELGHIGLNGEALSLNTVIHEVNGIKTLGVKDLIRSDELIVVATGPKMAKMVEFILNSEEDPKIPATILPSFENVTMIIDKHAGKLIKD